MGKSTPPPDFKIHVDSSCLTDSTDLEMPTQRITSDQTVVHHDSEENREQTPAEEDVEQAEELHHGNEKPQERRERLDSRIEAQIQEAARRVVASLERDNYDCHEESILSTQTGESYEEGTELTYDGTEVTHDGTEGTYESESEHQGDEHTEATYELESELDAHLEQALTAWEPDNAHSEKEQAITAWEPDNGQHSENDQGDFSSHHDGDIDDDVFSRDSGRSQSSLNSIHDLNSSDEAYQKTLTSPAVGEEAATSHPAEEPVSRVPSVSSYTLDESNLRTPSKVLHRPPFRTPSSVRAMQMSSPTLSLFSSPRSTKRHLPTVSRIGTPTSQYSPSKRTPTRFKAKKEQPLVLLHVTVMPLQWLYAQTLSSPEVPGSLHHVKESWRLLQDKLADTVLERGILLPHPQDSYEVLEERLLEALELPVHPRARILKCGHYMGPLDSETPSSDDESAESYFKREPGTDRIWCDICRKDVRLEDSGESSTKRRFNLKIYASNGLMRAGAWAAVWREMERVDVEIEPWVEVGLRAELEHLASIAPLEALAEEDAFVDEEDVVEHVHERSMEDQPANMSAEQRRAEEATRMKMQEEEMAQKIMEEEELHRKMHEENMRRKLMEEERMREVYGHNSPPMGRPHPSRINSSGQAVDPDSLPELLLAAFKVLIRDKKNIAIGVLSFLVLFLTLRPGDSGQQMQVVGRNIVPEIVSEAPRQVESIAAKPVASAVEVMAEMPAKVVEVVEEVVPEMLVVDALGTEEKDIMTEEEAGEATLPAADVMKEEVFAEPPVPEIEEITPLVLEGHSTDDLPLPESEKKPISPLPDDTTAEIPAAKKIQNTGVAEEEISI